MPAPGAAAQTAPIINEAPGAQLNNPAAVPPAPVSYTQLLQMLRQSADGH
jgi:hypothetical protein